MPFPRAKGGCYDPGIHVPLLAWWPGRIRAGSVARELISHVDLPVTWLEAAGIEKPRKMQGGSFLNLLLGKPYQPRKEIFAERNWHDNFDPIRAVRTDRHKLIFNAAPHFPYRPAWDLEGSPTWKSYLAAARAGKLGSHHLRLLAPTRPLVELYDLQRDPDEFHNLATSPEYAEALQDLKLRLSNWMHETQDFLPPATGRRGEPLGRGWPVSL
jgi:N-sulfoglucosamine sulfohydrolase